MKRLLGVMVLTVFLASSANCFGAIAICKVVKKKGNTIVVECEEVRGEFKKGSRVKMVSEND